MNFLERILEGIGEQQGKHPGVIIALALALTVFMALGVPNIRMETDFTKELPSDIPAMKLDERVTDTFGGYDAIVVVLRMDGSETREGAVKDIRDPRVMETLLELEDLAKEEKGVDKVSSIASVFKGDGVPKTTAEVKEKLSGIPGSNQAYSRDYSSTILSIYANLGSNEDAIKELTANIEEDLDAVSMPPGLYAEITGMPPIRTTMMDILQKDAVYTISIAAAIILVILVAISRPMSKGIIIFTPLTFGIVWTLGTMGWLDTPLSIATVGVGAMILGLGVEYGTFYVERYGEEIKNGSEDNTALKTSLREVGSAIVGSSTTTVVGFLALLLASMPMMHHLGTTLALGIIYCVVAALGVNPAIMVSAERFLHRREERKHGELDRRIKARSKGGERK